MDKPLYVVGNLSNPVDISTQRTTEEPDWMMFYYKAKDALLADLRVTATIQKRKPPTTVEASITPWIKSSRLLASTGTCSSSSG